MRERARGRGAQIGVPMSMLGPELLEAKAKGDPFKAMHVQLDLETGTLRATSVSKPPEQDAGPPRAILLVNCAYGATFQELPAKYAAMQVLALQEPGKKVYFLRFDNADDKGRWRAAIEGTMVDWPPLLDLSFEFMSGPGPAPEPEPEGVSEGLPPQAEDGMDVLVEPNEADEPITEADFDAARAVVERFEELDSLSKIPHYLGHPSKFRLLANTPHMALYKSKERACKHFLYRPSSKSCQGIPARFVQEVMRDDDFAVASNSHCIEFEKLGSNSGGNDILFQLVSMENFKSKPRELLAMRARRSDAAGNGSGAEETMMRSTFHPDKPLQHRLDETQGKSVSAFRAYQFVYSLVRPKVCAPGEPESCEVMGLMRLQPRGDCPRKAIDTVASQVVKDVWERVRTEAMARMEAVGLPLPPLFAAN